MPCIWLCGAVLFSGYHQHGAWRVVNLDSHGYSDLCTCIFHCTPYSLNELAKTKRTDNSFRRSGRSVSRFGEHDTHECQPFSQGRGDGAIMDTMCRCFNALGRIVQIGCTAQPHFVSLHTCRLSCPQPLPQQVPPRSSSAVQSRRPCAAHSAAAASMPTFEPSPDAKSNGALKAG